MLMAVEPVAVGSKAVDVGILAGLDDRPHWATDGIGDKTATKEHALLGELVDVWCADDVFEVAAIGTDGLVGVVVCEDEDDVGLLVFSGAGHRRGADDQRKSEQGNEQVTQ